MPEFADDHSYLMPAHFGGLPGGMAAITYWDTTVAMTRYATDGDALATLLPPGFELESPEVMVASMMNHGTEWMGGEPYNIVAVNVPARFEGSTDSITGFYSLVVWENRATPILPGREQTGIPKIYGEVEDFRFFQDDTMRTWAHYGGHSFCDLEFASIREATDAERAEIVDEFSTMNWMAWRYIPRAGTSGGAELSHATLFPQEFDATRVRVASATVAWSVPPVVEEPHPAPHHRRPSPACRSANRADPP